METLRGLATPIQTLPFRESYQAIFPSIGFTCAGSITGWTVIAIENPGQEATHYPELQVWRRSGKGTVFNRTASTMLRGGGDASKPFLFEYSVDPPLQFLAGDVLGVFEPRNSNNHLRVDYQYLSGSPEFFLVKGNHLNPPLQSANVSLNHWGGYHPLVAVTTGEHAWLLQHRVCECTTVLLSYSSNILSKINCLHSVPPSCSDGFSNHELLQSIIMSVDSGIILEDGIQTILPSTMFSCSGHITKWIVAAAWSGDYDLLPELQLWRQSSTLNGTLYYHKVDSTSLTADTRSSHQIYEFNVEPPMPFLSGDILGVFSPPCFGATCGRLRIIHERSSEYLAFYRNATSSYASFQITETMILQHHNRPLVRVEIGKSCYIYI